MKSRFLLSFGVLALLLFQILEIAAATSLRDVISLDGEWQIAEGSMTNVPATFERRVPVPGLVDMATPPFRPATYGKHVCFRPADDKGWLEIPFRVEQDISGDLVLRMTHSLDGGTYRVLLDGKAAGTLDLLSPKLNVFDDSLGRRTLTAGAHVLRFE